MTRTLTVMFSARGCGVSKDLYDARGMELDKLKREMAMAQSRA